MTSVDRFADLTDSAKQDVTIEFLRTSVKGKYLDEIDSLSTTRITISYQDLVIFESIDHPDFNLCQYMYENPKKFFSICTKAVELLFKERHGIMKTKNVYIDKVEPEILVVDALGHKFIKKLVTITGIITSSTELYVIPDHHIYICENGHKTKSSHNKFLQKCGEPECTSREFEDITPAENFKQRRTLYLKSENFGYHLDELRTDVDGDLANIVDSGDRVRVTCTLEPKATGKGSIHHNVARCFNITKLDDVDLSVSDLDEEEFKKMIDTPDFYARLIHSIAPSIFGWTNVKESILLQLFGSTNRNKSDGTQVRGWMHIGLFGDPGTAKTKFCEWITKSFSRTQLVMSKGATATGLIIGLEDGPDGRKVLRTGAMVNCRDGGIVCIDEFPRLPSEVIDALYTTSESGIASSAKTGNQSKIRADASLILTGNAHNGRWNDALSIQDNLAVDQTFLTRLDFMWIFTDAFNERTDNILADTILDDAKYDEDAKPFSSARLAKYVKYCRTKFHPILVPEVQLLLKNAWMELRRDPNARDNGITARQLETLERTTLAIARLHQRNYATEEDASKAIRLLREMYNQRNISIGYADTYVQRNLNKSLEILKMTGVEGLQVGELFDKILCHGSEEEQKQVRADLGTIREHTINKKWRTVIDELKRSHLIEIRSKKPLVLAYRHDLGNIGTWTKSNK